MLNYGQVSSIRGFEALERMMKDKLLHTFIGSFSKGGAGYFPEMYIVLLTSMLFSYPIYE